LGYYALTISRSMSRAIAREVANASRGIPIPGTGRGGHWGKANASRNSGVMGNSRILPHRYMDELDNGRQHRREIRRKENVMWKAEAFSEMEEEFYEMMCEPDF
jgi:hypothetical protein